MAIKNWPGWSIGLLWLAWLLPVLLMARASREPPPGHWTGTADLSTDSLSDSQRVILFYLLKDQSARPHPDSSRLAALARLSTDSALPIRDSLWHALALPAHLTPAQRDSIGAAFLQALTPIAESIGQPLGSRELWWGLLFRVVGTFLLPVIVLVIITLKWYVPRVVERARRNAA